MIDRQRQAMKNTIDNTINRRTGRATTIRGGTVLDRVDKKPALRNKTRHPAQLLKATRLTPPSSLTRPGEIKAYQRGKDDAARGAPRDACPYIVKNGLLAAAWLMGFDERTRGIRKGGSDE